MEDKKKLYFWGSNYFLFGMLNGLKKSSLPTHIPFHYTPI